MYTRGIMDKKKSADYDRLILVLLLPLSVNNGVVRAFLVNPCQFVNAVREQVICNLHFVNGVAVSVCYLACQHLKTTQGFGFNYSVIDCCREHIAFPFCAWGFSTLLSLL